MHHHWTTEANSMLLSSHCISNDLMSYFIFMKLLIIKLYKVIINYDTINHSFYRRPTDRQIPWSCDWRDHHWCNFVKDFFASIRDIVGGRSGSYERVLSEARDTAMKELVQRAEAIGANAIVGIDIDYETIGANGSMLMVAVSGTAVVLV